MLFAAATVAVACSDDPPAGVDSGAPRSDAAIDGSASSDSATDDVASDAGTTEASPDATVLDGVGDAQFDGATDGDGGCACTLVDTGMSPPFQFNGRMSLPCYCEMPWFGIGPAPACASYELATRCDGTRNFTLETYTNCNLVTLWYSAAFTIDARVYDHTTHELVGAFRGTDHSLPCAGSQAFMMVTGTIPGPECQSAKIERPCGDDAGPGDGGAADVNADTGDAVSHDDADAVNDADGGCTCEPDDQRVSGKMSLSCYCAPGRCPSYDDALTRCGPDSPPEFNRVEDYEACNLVVITSGTSIPGGTALVYDRTTHELVGAASGADYPAFPCADASVFGYRAGTMTPAGCAMSRSVPRCPRDGG